MDRFAFSCLIILLLFVQQAFGQINVETSGAAESELITYDKDTQDALFRADYEAQINYEAVKLVVKPRLEVSSYRSSGLISGFSENSDRWLLNFREVYGRLQYSPIELRIGKQVISPSIINGRIKPARWAPTDYLNPLQSERIAVPAVQLRLFSGLIRGWYTPAETPSRLPNEPWRPPSLVGVESVSQITAETGYGVRLYTQLQKTQFGFGYQHGQNFSPHPILLTIARQPQLTFVHNPVDQGYVQLSRPVADFMFESEVSLVHETITGSDRTYVTYVLHLQRQWQVGLFGDTITGSLQYVGEFGGSISSDTRLFDFRRNMKRTVFTRVKYQRSNFVYELESGLTVRDGGGYVLQPSIGYDHNRFLFEIGAGFLGGSSKTFWGQFADNDFMSLSVRFTL